MSALIWYAVLLPLLLCHASNTTNMTNSTNSSSISISLSWNVSDSATEVPSSTGTIPHTPTPTSSIVATESDSMSSSISASDTGTVSPSITPSDRSASQSISDSKTLVKSSSTTMTMTVVETPTFTFSESDSASLPWLATRGLFWWRRPLSYAAPSVPLSIQPVLYVGGGYLNSEALPSRCYVKAATPDVVLGGHLSVPAFRSICVWSDLRIVSGPVNVPITLQFFANTSMTTRPYVKYHPRNSTVVVLASCPHFTNPLFRFSPSRVAAENITDADLQIDVSGFYFPYHAAHEVFCSLHHEEAATSLVQAVFVDMCHVSCFLSPAILSSLVNATKPFRGKLTLQVGNQTVSSACAGNDVFPLSCGNSEPLQEPSCLIQLFSTDVQQLTFHLSPANNSIVISFSLERMQPFAFVEGSEGTFNISVCDSASNPVRFNETKLMLNFSDNVISYDAKVHDNVITVSNLVFQRDGNFSRCGDPLLHQGFVLYFGILDQVQRSLLYCFEAAQSNRNDPSDARIEFLEVINEDQVLNVTDDASTLPVPLEIQLMDWSRQLVSGLNRIVILEVTILQKGTVWNETSSKKTTQSSELGAATTNFSTLVCCYPLRLTDIRIPWVGQGFGLRLRVMEGAFPSRVLWGAKYPVEKSITVHSCRPHANFFQISSVTTIIADFTSCLSDGSKTAESLVSSRMWLRRSNSSETTVTVHGWRFAYGRRHQMLCHYANVFSPWNLSNGSPIEWVSSCEVKCRIPPQVFPISTSGLYRYNQHGEVVLKSKEPAATDQHEGHLRLRYDELLAWSNPYPIDIIGEAASLETHSWQGLQDTFAKRDYTRLPSLIVGVVDALMSPLNEFDVVSRSISLFLPKTDPKYDQLNNSNPIFRQNETCTTAAGATSFTNLFLIAPALQSYQLLLASVGLQTSGISLHIAPAPSMNELLLQLVSPSPLPFIVVNDDSRGKLPIQPAVGLFIETPEGNWTLGTNISDVVVVAVVSPLTANVSAEGNGVNIPPTECSDYFGNCAVVNRGLANFTALKFSGEMGAYYTLVLQLRNKTSSINVLNFTIYVAECNVTQQLAAYLIGPSNVRLFAPSEGILVKGWKFDFSQTKECLFNGTTFPATVIDSCTLRCMAVAAGAQDTCSTSSARCCFDGMQAMCREPVEGTLEVRLSDNSIPLAAGMLRFVGEPSSIRVLNNPSSANSIFGNHQIVSSDALSVLDDISIGFFDSIGQFVGNTFSSDGLEVSLQTPVIRGNKSEVKIPAPYVGAYNDDPTTTCFREHSSVLNMSLGSPLRCAVKNGTCTFSNIAVRLPSAGQFDFYFEAELNGAIVQATFSLHVLAGKPASLCLLDNFTEVKITLLGDPRQQPTLFLLDAAQNLVQPLSLDSRLTNLEKIQGFYANFTLGPLSADVYHRFLPEMEMEQEEGNSTTTLAYPFQYLNTIEENVDVISGIDGAFGALQYKFKNLRLAPQHGQEYKVVFKSDGLVSTSTPALTMESCPLDHFSPLNTSKCDPCPSGSDRCYGFNLQCFLCNGGSHMNVTANYWRANENTHFAYSCPLDSCAGSTPLGTCEPGYLDHSPLCMVCSEDYAADFIGYCVKCGEIAVTIVILSIGVLVAMLFLVIIIIITLKEESASDNALVLITKIAVNFVQTSGMIGQMKMSMPTTVKRFLGFQSAASGGSGISISPITCLAPDMTLLEKLQLQLLGPVVLLTLLAVILALLSRYKKWRNRNVAASERQISFGSKRFSYRHLFNIITTIFLFLVYQTLITICVSVIRCRELKTDIPGNEIRITFDDARVECAGSYYERNAALAFYGLAIYGVGIPCFAMVLVMVVAKRHGWDRANMEFSFLINGYRLKYWFWEVFIMFRKVAMLIILATIDHDVGQALLAIWLLTIVFVITNRCKPFVLKVLNRCESLSLLTLVVTLNAGLFFRSIESTREGCGVMCVLLIIVIIGLNVLLIGYFAYNLVIEARNSLLEMFGVDAPGGHKRLVSLHSIRDVIYSATATSKVPPNFKTYTPKMSKVAELVMMQLEGEDEGEEAVRRFLQEVDILDTLKTPHRSEEADDLDEEMKIIQAGE